MYKILKIKNAINSPLKSISKPDVKDKKQMLKKLSFFTVVKKNKRIQLLKKTAK